MDIEHSLHALVNVSVCTKIPQMFLPPTFTVDGAAPVIMDIRETDDVKTTIGSGRVS